MSRQDERQRIQRRLGALTSRVGASRTGIAGAAEASRPLGGRRARLGALPAPGGCGELARERRKDTNVRSMQSVHARASVGLVQGAGRRSTGLGGGKTAVLPEASMRSEKTGSLARGGSSRAAARNAARRSGEPDVSAEFSGSTEARVRDELPTHGVPDVDQQANVVPVVDQQWGEASPEDLAFSTGTESADVESSEDRRLGQVGLGASRASRRVGRFDLAELNADGGPSARAGQWDLAELPDESEDDEDGDFGAVRSPGWLDEPDADPGWRDRLVPERFRGTRLDPGRRGACTLLAIGVVAMVIAAVVIFHERPVARPVPPLPAVRTTTAPVVARMSGAEPPSTAASPAAAPVPGEPNMAAGTELVVSVVGLVHRTGLVRLPAGSRVADALTAAGGAQDGADLAGLNLAQRLIDGDQVLVGPPGPNPGPPKLGSTTINAGGRTSAPPSGSAHPATPSGRVDLNTATESELEALPGIGPVMAKAIIAWRTTRGRFTDVTQLGQVDGIGPARLARLRELVKV